MKAIIAILLMFAGMQVMAGDNQCSMGGCDFTVQCTLTDGDGTVKGSFLTGGLNYILAASQYVYINNGLRLWYNDLNELIGDDDPNGAMIPDLNSPLTPIISLRPK